MFKMLMQYVAVIVLAIVSCSASSQEQSPSIPCAWGNIDITNPTCDRPLAILKQYRNASSFAEHQSLLTALNQVRNDEYRRQVKNGKEQFYDPYIDEALTYWLDWYQVAVKARPENQQLLDEHEWRAVIQLAHRDPYAALTRLNKINVATDVNQKALGLLLTGMLNNHLRIFVEAANYAAFLIKSKDSDERVRTQRLETYVQSHPQDFYVGETCYGENYKGRHFFAVEKQFPQSPYAQAARYLALTINPCGECEGVFACYLSENLRARKEFFSKYPQSDYVPMLLKRVQNDLRGHFIEQEARGDFLAKIDPQQSRELQSRDYIPIEAANVLIDFEHALKHISTPQLLSIKFLLGDLYVSLGQMGNAKRVYKWFAENAPNSPEWKEMGSSILSPRFSRPVSDPSLVVKQRNLIKKNYRLQECELEKAWLGQEGMHCQEVRLVQ